MKPKDIIGLVFRLVGLLGILYVVRHLYHVWHRTGSPHLYEPLRLIFELLLIVIGIYMVCGCPLFMRIVYPDEKSDSPEDPARDRKV